MMTNSISLSSLNSCPVSNRQYRAARPARPAFAIPSIVEWMTSLKCVRVLAEMYSGLMEETITPLFTLHLLHVQLAVFANVMPVGMDFLLRLALLLWLGTSLALARRAYSDERKK